jgi:hypothetical protein
MQILKTTSIKSVETKIKNGKPRLNASQTIRSLNEALAGKDLNYFRTVNVDRVEAAKFIEKQTKILRFVSISAELPTITKLVEEMYYSAYEESLFHHMPDYKAFREMLRANEKHSTP